MLAFAKYGSDYFAFQFILPPHFIHSPAEASANENQVFGIELSKFCKLVSLIPIKGPYGGRAVAAVLFGDYNPAGRTHTTWYKSTQDLPSMGEMDLYAGNGISYR